MDPHIYEELRAQEHHHWWFASRRAIICSLLHHIHFPGTPLILDAGCGSGGNLPLLASIGSVFAMEPDEKARSHAASLGIGRVAYGRLPDDIPFPGLRFDLITLFDVLEHVEDDRAALTALTARMQPGAVLCLTLPACQWLFSRLDREHHHYRRYSRKTMRRLLQEAGLEIQMMNHWNCALFPAALAVRLLEKTIRRRGATIGSRIPVPWLNRLLQRAVSAERHLIPRLPLPFGLSLVILARKPSVPRTA